jgi:hypothetical protein
MERFNLEADYGRQSGTEASSLEVIWFPLATCHHACNWPVYCHNLGPQLGLHFCPDNLLVRFILYWCCCFLIYMLYKRKYENVVIGMLSLSVWKEGWAPQ